MPLNRLLFYDLTELIMSDTSPILQLPSYSGFVDSIASLALPFSASELHGLMCGYLCAGALQEGTSYLRAIMGNTTNKRVRAPALVLFALYAVSQQQLERFDFEFQLLLPEDEEPLSMRAQAFSEWCTGFGQGIMMAGVREEQLEEDAQEALKHIQEFGRLDYSALDIDDDDERAFIEVSEYARMAVLHIRADLLSNNLNDSSPETAH